MRLVVIVSLFLAWVLIVASNPPQQQEAGWTDASAQVASRALETPVLISCGIVFLFFYLRFSEWPRNTALYLVKRPPRFYTTRLRYQIAASIYGILMVGMFLIIYLFPDAFLGILRAASEGANTIAGLGPNPAQGGDESLAKIISDLAQHVSEQRDWLYTAIVLVIVIWPKVPFSTDEAIRATLQRFAAIPTEARILINRMHYREDSFVAEKSVVMRLVEKSTLIEPNDFNPGTDSGRIGFLYAKLLYLTDRVAIETLDRGFASAALQQPERYEDMERRVAEIALRLTDFRSGYASELQVLKAEEVDVFFHDEVFTPSNCPLQRLIDFSHTVLDPNDATARYLQQQEKALTLELEQMLDDLYYFIVTSILSSEKSPRVRVLRFAHLGIDLPRDYLPFEEGNALTYLFALLFVATAVPTLVFSATTLMVDFSSLQTQCGKLVPNNFPEALSWSVIAMLQHGLAVVAAFVLTFAMEAHLGKEVEIELLQSDRDKFRRTASAVSAFVNGAVIAFSANVVLFALLSQIWMPADALDCRLDSTWTWALVPALTGGLTALYLNVEPRRGYAWTLAVLLQAVSTGFIAMMVGMSSLMGTPEPEGSFSMVRIAFLVYVFVTASLLGLAAGRIVLQVVGELSAKKMAFEQFGDREAVSATLRAGDRRIPVELRNLSPSEALVEQNLELESGTSGWLWLPSVGKIPVMVDPLGENLTRLLFQTTDVSECVQKKCEDVVASSNNGLSEDESSSKQPSDA